MTRGALEGPFDERFSFSRAARFLSRICTYGSHSRLKNINKDEEITI
jgi:hypothetical protein